MNKNSVTLSDIKKAILARGIGRISKELEAFPRDAADWSDAQLIEALGRHLLVPNAGHLAPHLRGLESGGHFMCGEAEWQVTDIGSRTLTAIKIEEKERSDPSWLAGPPYAIAEFVFDEDDVDSIEPMSGN